ncbi:Glycosyltransferase involved in cell wall bisynthesis [Halopelagius inordinatus]|uniref:Glycosyltransferase involved in cell wall bisynthesis n=1 Tax=Halopelagius inordinatus TaxID=553467 RepID=A0A1I2UBR1_9EURY|nr:glycosyltransferase [Halopelagius inordinatus]SFG73077.1 Glycosyltransferase involved in cell wall bisynthesis [Halopelagius inordinatus]
MKVLFLPDFTDGNPYQRRLSEGLSAEDVDVTLASGYPLSTLRTALKTRPDIVHVHWIAPFLVGDSILASLLKSVVFVLSTLLAKLLGVRVVWTVHNLLEHERRRPRFELFWRRLYARLADEIIVHCEAARDSVVEQYRLPTDSRVHVIPHGHYCSAHENTVSRGEARERLGVERDSTVFLYLGQIRPYKQIPRLVDTVRSLESPDVRLLVAGKPTDESLARAIEASAEGDSRIATELSYIPEEEVQTYFNAADAVVLPYRDILTSGSAVLSMSFGKPVVGPRTGCLPELLRTQPELLYDPDSESLDAALVRALDADLDLIGDRNYERVTELDWGGIAARTRDAYQRTRT